MIGSKFQDLNSQNQVDSALERATTTLKDREQLFMNTLNFISSYSKNPMSDFHQLSLLQDHIDLNKSKNHLFSLNEKSFLPLLPTKAGEPTKEVIRAVFQMIQIVDMTVLQTKKQKIDGITLEFTREYQKIKRKYTNFVQGTVTIQNFVAELLHFSSQKNLKQINILETFYEKNNADHQATYINIQNPQLQQKNLKFLPYPTEKIIQEYVRSDSHSFNKKKRKYHFRESENKQLQIKSSKNQNQISRRESKQYELKKILKNYSILDLNIKEYSDTLLLYKEEANINSSERLVQKLTGRNKANQEQIQKYFKKRILSESPIKQRRRNPKRSLSKNSPPKNQKKLSKNKLQSLKSSRIYEDKIKPKQRAKSAPFRSEEYLCIVDIFKSQIKKFATKRRKDDLLEVEKIISEISQTEKVSEYRSDTKSATSIKNMIFSIFCFIQF